MLCLFLSLFSQQWQQECRGHAPYGPATKAAIQALWSCRDRWEGQDRLWCHHIPSKNWLHPSGHQQVQSRPQKKNSCDAILLCRCQVSYIFRDNSDLQFCPFFPLLDLGSSWSTPSLLLATQMKARTYLTVIFHRILQVQHTVTYYTYMFIFTCFTDNTSCYPCWPRLFFFIL